MKVLCNKKAFHDRSIIRNLLFDCLRCLVRPLLFPLLFEGSLNTTAAIEVTLVAMTISIVSTLFVKREWFDRVPLLWAILNIEYVLCFADSLLYVINSVERVYNGSLIVMLFAVGQEIHFSLQGYLLEDLLFRDLRMLGGLWHNWDFYVPYVLMIPAWTYLQ